MIAGISSASARVTALSPAASASRWNIGSTTAARPEVEGIRKASGISAAVIRQTRLPTLTCRLATALVIRVARPLVCTAAPSMNAPIISQITSASSASNRSSCSIAPVSDRNSAAPSAT